MLRQLASGELDDYQRIATVAVIVDALFPEQDKAPHP